MNVQRFQKYDIISKEAESIDKIDSTKDQYNRYNPYLIFSK